MVPGHLGHLYAPVLAGVELDYRLAVFGGGIVYGLEFREAGESLSAAGPSCQLKRENNSRWGGDARGAAAGGLTAAGGGFVFAAGGLTAAGGGFVIAAGGSWGGFDLEPRIRRHSTPQARVLWQAHRERVPCNLIVSCKIHLFLLKSYKFNIFANNMLKKLHYDYSS